MANLYTSDHLLTADIVGITETWNPSDNLSLQSPWNKKFDSVYSPATREKSLGRSSGGILLLTKPSFTTTIIDKSALWIFVNINVNTFSAVIGVVYLKPSYEMSEALDLLQLLLNDLRARFVNMPVITGGDFNGRLGTHGVLDANLIAGTNLKSERKSLDGTSNCRGMLLLDFMYHNGFVLLNGRTQGDESGLFTFVSGSGCSTIDFVWINLDYIDIVDDFTVITEPTLSDHFPISTDIILPYFRTDLLNQANEKRHLTITDWDTNKIINYKLKLENEFIAISGGDFFNWTTNRQNAEITSILNTVARELDIKKTITLNSDKTDKVWFDKECKQAKRFYKRSLNTFKSHNFENDYKNDYLEARKAYNKLIIIKKNHFTINLKNKLANIKNSSEFWTAFKKFNSRKLHENPITLDRWETFYDNIYPPRLNLDITFFGTFDNILDVDISLTEIDKVIKKIKKGKAPGCDEINADFYKNLPNNWKILLQTLFNNILLTEMTPSSWSEAILVLFHKKGSKNEPGNYRGIALTNTISKIFTHILHERLFAWANKVNVLPESQGGFRPKRSCLENIYILQSVIHLKLRLDKGHAYAIFIDFKRAFDSISHYILWSKLYSFGLSAKFIRTLKYVYDNASFRVKLNNIFSKKFDISEGVLQGEVLSPLLLILFISDFERFLRDRGLEGIDINGYIDLLLLLYADDAVALTASSVQMHRLIRAIELYCDQNLLTVNTDKTKIVYFKKGGRNKEETFHMNGNQLEMVNSYTYLGVTIANSALGLQATKQNIVKARSAIGAAMQTFCKSKSDSWDCKLKIFDSIVTSILLYAAPVWSLNYLNNIEIVQTDFFKRLLSLPKSTANATLRLELGLVKLEHKVFKLTWRWIVAMLEMGDERYAKKCFLRQVALFLNGSPSAEYNWVVQFDRLLSNISFNHLWNSLNPRVWRGNENLALKKYYTYLKVSDLIWYQRSNFNNVNIIVRTLGDSTAGYLSQRNLNFLVNIIAQFHLSSKYYLRFTHKGQSHVIDQDAICMMCNMLKFETLEHFLIECPLYRHLRTHFLAMLDLTGDVPNHSKLTMLLYVSDPELLKNIFYYIVNALRLRSFSLNE